MYHIFLIHSPADGHLDCFHVLAIVRSAGINTGAHVSFWIVILSGYVPSSGIAESYGNSILGFRGTSILYTVFHNGCTNSHLSVWYFVCVCVELSTCPSLHPHMAVSSTIIGLDIQWRKFSCRLLQQCPSYSLPFAFVLNLQWWRHRSI